MIGLLRRCLVSASFLPHSLLSRAHFRDSNSNPVNADFKDGWDYYLHASSAPFLDSIAIPHLSLQSRDDPMVLPSNLPYAQARKSGHVVLATTGGGGHVAWFTGGGMKRWFTTPLREFVEGIHSVSPAFFLFFTRLSFPFLSPSRLPPS